MTKSNISVIIAAKNEEKRIAGVLKIVCDHPAINQVVVSCSGSTDNTVGVAKKFGVDVVNNPNTKGKTLAVKEALEVATGEYILLLDADLVGLSSGDINKMIRPVLDNKADCTLSIRKNGLFIFKILKCEFVSGERFLKKEYLMDKFIWAMPEIGYGLEVRMNATLLKKKVRFCAVPLNIKNIMKSKKNGFLKGAIRDFNMAFVQLPKAITYRRYLRQIIVMSYPKSYSSLYPESKKNK